MSFDVSISLDCKTSLRVKRVIESTTNLSHYFCIETIESLVKYIAVFLDQS